MQMFTGRIHSQVAVADTPQGEEIIGQCLDLFGLAPDDNNLQAVIMIHMHMGRGDNLVVVFMLQGGDFFLHLGLMVIINKGDDAHDILVGGPFILDKALPDQIADRF